VNGYTRWQWFGIALTALAILAVMTLPVLIA
jgi:hypothetical protein